MRWLILFYAPVFLVWLGLLYALGFRKQKKISKARILCAGIVLFNPALVYFAILGHWRVFLGASVSALALLLFAARRENLSRFILLVLGFFWPSSWFALFFTLRGRRFSPKSFYWGGAGLVCLLASRSLNADLKGSLGEFNLLYALGLFDLSLKSFRLGGVLSWVLPIFAGCGALVLHWVAAEGAPTPSQGQSGNHRLLGVGAGTSLLLASLLPGLSTGASLIFISFSPLLLLSDFKKGCRLLLAFTLLVCFEGGLFADGAGLVWKGSALLVPPSAFYLAIGKALIGLFCIVEFWRPLPTLAPTCDVSPSLFEPLTSFALPVRFKLTGYDFIGLGLALAMAIWLTFSQLGSRQFPATSVRLNASWRIKTNSIEPVSQLWLLFGMDAVEVGVRCDSSGENQILSIGKGEFAYHWYHVVLSRPCSKEFELTLKSPNLEAVAYEVAFAGFRGRMLREGEVCQFGLCTSLRQHPLFDESQFNEAPNFQEDIAFDEIFNIGPGVQRKLHPEETVHTVHPLLGRWFIAKCMDWFGFSPWSWRLPGAIAGVLIPLVLFFLSRELFPGRLTAWLVLFFSLCDLLRLGLSRIALVDSQMVFWLLLAYLFLFQFYRLAQQKHVGGWSRASKFSRLLLFGMAWGCAASCKWIGLFPAPLFLWVLLRSEVKIGETFTHAHLRAAGLKMACLVSILVLIYFGSFRLFDEKINFASFFKAQKKMFAVHSQVISKDEMSSSFLSWPFGDVSLSTFARDVTGPFYERSSFFPNPALYWAMFPAFFFLLLGRARKKNDLAWFLFAAFALQYLPWAFISRKAYIYHFYSASVFGLLAIAGALGALDWKKSRHWVGLYCVAVLGVALWFLPMVTARKITLSRFEAARWFPQWFIDLSPPTRMTIEREPSQPNASKQGR